jgi:hypothetical protein
MTFEYPELSGKRLEILKEVFRRIRRVLENPSSARGGPVWS